MKFLHTADLHLDAAFCLSSATEAEARRERQREVLRKIFDTARDEQCDMMLIAGDLFDTPYVTPETRELCIKLFGDFGKPIVIAPGNHDAYIDGCFYKDTALPENVYVFSSNELQFYDFYELDVTVAGYAFTSAAMTSSPLCEPLPTRHNGRVLLLCAHTEVDAPMSHYAPITGSEIAKQSYDYAALGHIHKYTEIRENIRYCGFAEGRSFDETGEGCVLIVTADGASKPTVERSSVADVRYEWAQLTLDASMTCEQAEAAIRRTLEAYTHGINCRLRLEIDGTLSGDAADAVKRAGESLPSGILSLEILDRALVLPDGEALDKDTTLKGEFYRSLLPLLLSEDKLQREKALKALYIGLAAIEGRELRR